MRIQQLTFFIGPILLILFFAACQPDLPNQVFVEVDGNRESLTLEGGTVRDALDTAGVELGELDRVRPDLYTQLEPGLTIVVTRVREALETERQTLPYERQIVVNEALAPGESRMAQLGVNGEEEISIRVVYENEVEVSRTEISRETVTPAVSEIMVVGPAETLPSIQLDGTVAYLSNGNAWLMRSTNRSRRALTTDGNLDGRVLSLSPDGGYLLYTTPLTDDIEMPLNELWLASAAIVGEPPLTTGIRGVLNAEWSPVISPALIAYSTAQRTANAPGWQANNDLWLARLSARPGDEWPPQPVEIIPANTQGLYSWWGTSFTWSPDGSKLAYARPDQIGVINVITSSNQLDGSITPLLDFVPLQTFSDWVWVPAISWSPDSRFIAATVHGDPLAEEPPEESQVFDLWLLSVDGKLSAKVREQVGMWANPAWSEAGIAYGRAVEPLQSVNSRYVLELIDRDGSNRRQIFPFRDEPGVLFPELVWSPDNSQLLFVYNGNLHLTSRQGGVPYQLTTDGQVRLPQWSLATTGTLTSTMTLALPTVTPSPTPGPATPTSPPTRTPRATATVTASATPTRTPTAVATASRPPTRTATPDVTASGTPRRTATPTRTSTLAATASRTATPSRTATLVATASRTPAAAVTGTRTPTLVTTAVVTSTATEQP